MQVLPLGLASLGALGAALVALVQDPAPSAGATDPAEPVAAFAPWNGSWRGTFVGYDPTGKELYRIGVEQRYERVDAHTQSVTIRDTMADGTVIRATGRNTARRLADGTLELRCIVDKDNGEHVEHVGKLARGPDGDQQLVWSSTGGKNLETFREWVYRGADGTRRYAIHGMGRYGGQLMLMAGEYQAVDPDKR